jgi:ribose transport system permease protein
VAPISRALFRGRADGGEPPVPGGEGQGELGAQAASGRRFAPLARYVSVAVLVGTILLFSGLLPSTFPTLTNAKVMLTSESVILIMALGVTFTLRLGDLDLSFASVMNLSCAVIAILTVQHHVNALAASGAALATGVIVGSINALMVVKLKLNSFIATLGMQTALGGITYGITGSQIVVGLPNSFLDFGRDSIIGIPLNIWYGWILCVVVWVIYEFTVYGRHLLFIGGNQTAARLAGIRVQADRTLAYMISGLIYAFAGLILASVVGSADPSAGLEYLLPPLAGAFLGTTAIQLGRFNVWGTVVGVYLLMVISTGLELLGAASWVADVFDGAALIVAIGFARLAIGRTE